MTRKQTSLIALLCVIAAVLAALMLWREPTPPGGQGHAGQESHASHEREDSHDGHDSHDSHEDSHGHDDRHQEGAQGRAPAAPESGVAMTEAQVKANGIAIGTAAPALLREQLHLPAQVKVNAERTVALASPAQGMVQSVPVSVGSPVRKGQPLVVIQSPAVAQWRADYSSARQRVALATTTWQLEKMLWEQRISARQDMEAAQSALAEARINAEAAGERLRALGIAPGDGEAGRVSGSLTIRAPLAGVVVDKAVVAGQAVDDTRPLLTIADLSQVWVEAAVPAESLGQVATGMPARVSVNAQPKALDGALSFVGPVLGESTRMATARVALPNPGLRLRPGMLATVDILGQQASVPVAVASEAIQTIHERSVVFVRTAGGFRPQTVTLGRTDGKRTEIVGGLEAGTKYAAGGSFLLKADLGKLDADHH